MPDCLTSIREAVGQSNSASVALGVSQQRWAQRQREYYSLAGQQVPDVQIHDGGETVYLGQLSPGCQACKQGTWDCIFTTMRCNLNCDFCCSPQAIDRDFAGSAFGSSPEEIAANHAKTTITGISFSGGDPLVDKRSLFQWVGYFKNRSPQLYTWLYTNGVLLGDADLQQLKALGIDEIRFNLAATGYTNARVLRNLACAVEHIPHVTVEVPAIPEHAPKLLSSLAIWASLGVKYLNLHELMYEAGTNAASLAGQRCRLALNDGHQTDVNPDSRWLTLAVMKRVRDDKLPLSVNDCSMQSKIRQLRGRRRSLAPLVKRPYEKLQRQETYESYGAYRSPVDYFFVHPDEFGRVRRAYSNYHLVKLARFAPLSLKEDERWVIFEPVT